MKKIIPSFIVALIYLQTCHAMEEAISTLDIHCQEKLYQKISQKLLCPTIQLSKRIRSALRLAKETNDESFFCEIAECIFIMPEFRNTPNLVPFIQKLKSASHLLTVQSQKHTAKRWYDITQLLIEAQPDIDYDTRDHEGCLSLMLAQQDQAAQLTRKKSVEKENKNAFDYALFSDIEQQLGSPVEEE